MRQSYGVGAAAQTTHTSGLMPVPLFSFTKVPRQPVNVPPVAGAPVFAVLTMAGRR